MNDDKDFSPASYTWDPKGNGDNVSANAADEPESPVFVRRKLKKGYAWASSLPMWPVGITTAVMFVVTLVFSMVRSPQIAAANPDISLEEITALVTAELNENLALCNSIIMIFADALGVLIVYKSTKRFSLKGTLGKSALPAGSIAQGCIALIGIQGLSALVQSAVIMLTGYIGVSETTQASLGFGDSLLSNILLIFYGVIAGPILEELLYRGVALNLLAPVDRKFAVIVSALLFALMHGNFNQMFNTFFIGLLFGYIAVKCGSVVPSIIGHMVINFNAFVVLGLLCETVIANSMGAEAAAIAEGIIVIAEAVIGLPFLIVFLKSHGKIEGKGSLDGSYSADIDGNNTWGLLLKTPVFWVSAVIFIGLAIGSITAVA